MFDHPTQSAAEKRKEKYNSCGLITHVSMLPPIENTLIWIHR